MLVSPGFEPAASLLACSRRSGSARFFFLFVNFSSALYYLNAWNRLPPAWQTSVTVIWASPRFRHRHSRVVTWYMGSGLKAQNMTGIRAQRKRLRAQKNGIRDHKAFKPEPGIVDKVSAYIISWPRYITYSCFRLAAVPVIRSLSCLTKTWYHILNLLIV